MNIDNPAALRFIMQDDIFLLKNEAGRYEKGAVAGLEEVAVAVAEAVPENVKIHEPSPQPVVKQAQPIKYKGNNKNGYVILVHYSGHEWMHDAHLTALENTLKRKGIEPADVAIINMAAHSDMAYEEVTAQLKPQKLLLMGKEALPAGMQVKFNQLHQLPCCTALYTFSFGEMMDSNDSKKIFWEQMKAL